MNIAIENLTKSYGHQKAVDNISFEVKTGEILGFLGPNGAGKTTTMKMITQYIEPDKGDIFIDNKTVRSFNSKRNIGYLPEHNSLYPEMPILDYLFFVGSLQGIPKNELAQRVREMVRVCGLEAEKHKKIGELSKGYRQRVGLAQAIIHNPEILILDEPTTGLDPNQIVEIRELIKELGKAKTVILSTHILPEVEATCDRILIINNGRIVADGTAENLRAQSQGTQILQVRIEDGEPADIQDKMNALGSVQNVKMLEFQRFEVKSASDLTSNRAIFELCKKEGWTLTEMIPFETKLEDIFRNLTMK
jgi:ABC-2 type transport system ATP-binding protein